MKRAGLVVGLLASIAVGSVAVGQPPGEKRVFADGVFASCHDGNEPANAVDGNLKTRWSCNVDGAELHIQTSWESYTGVEIAFYQGSANRIANFDVFVDRGDEWQPMILTLDAEPTDQLARYNFPNSVETNTFGFRVIIIGHGNSRNVWNSITEVRIYARIDP